MIQPQRHACTTYDDPTIPGPVVVVATGAPKSHRLATRAWLRVAAVLLLAALTTASCGDAPQAHGSSERTDADTRAPAEPAVAVAAAVDPGTMKVFEDSYRQAYGQALEQARPGHAAEAQPRDYGFRRSLSEQRRNIQAFTSVQRTAPGQDQATIDFLGSGQALAAAHRQLRDAGLDPANVADTLSLLYATAWQVVNDAPMTARDVRAVRHNAMQVLVHDPAMHMRDDAERQRAADGYAQMASLLQHEDARLRDNGVRAERLAFRDAVRRYWLAQSGVDLSQVEIGDDGFAPR